MTSYWQGFSGLPAVQPVLYPNLHVFFEWHFLPIVCDGKKLPMSHIQG